MKLVGASVFATGKAYPTMNTHAMVTMPRWQREEPAQARFFGLSLRFWVLGYCIFQVGDLVGAWRPGGPEGSGPLIFALWLLPIWVAGMGRIVEDRPQKQLLAAALVLGLLGQLTWLNVLQHAALVLAIVGWRQPLPGQWWWVAASFLWMPASGWALAGLGASLALTLRIAGTVAVSGGVSWRLQRLVKLAVWGVVLLLVPSVPVAHAGPIGGPSQAPFQSAARPFGLDIVGPVYAAGSDTQAADFLTNVLPQMQTMINQTFGPALDPANLPQVPGWGPPDPNALTLVAPADLRVYFVGEGAGWRNSLGFNTDGPGHDSGNPQLIFPNSASPASYLSSKPHGPNAPLMPGDFVNLGTFDPGTKLDFFLIGDGANPGRRNPVVWSTDPSFNSDGLDHVVSFAQVQSPYVLIGFEDLPGGGDRDFNDLLFAVHFGEANVGAMLPSGSVPVSEPAFIWVMLLGFGGWLDRSRRKRRARSLEALPEPAA